MVLPDGGGENLPQYTSKRGGLGRRLRFPESHRTTQNNPACSEEQSKSGNWNRSKSKLRCHSLPATAQGCSQVWLSGHEGVEPYVINSLAKLVSETPSYPNFPTKGFDYPARLQFPISCRRQRMDRASQSSPMPPTKAAIPRRNTPSPSLDPALLDMALN